MLIRGHRLSWGYPYLERLNVLSDVLYKVFRSFLNTIEELFVYVELFIHSLMK